MPDPAHRASDAEREAVAERLRRAAAEGRLDPDELDERLGRAYGARTVGELAPLTEDLPAAAVVPAPEPRTPALRAQHVRARLATFITVNVVCIAIWAASGADGSFWPIWVLLGTGIGVFSTVVKALLGVEEEDDRPGRRAERRERRR
jgi:hypothetical protein